MGSDPLFGWVVVMGLAAVVCGTLCSAEAILKAWRNWRAAVEWRRGR